MSRWLLILIVSLLFLIPIKNLKEDNDYLEEERFILEIEQIENQKMIDSLNTVNNILKNEIDKLKFKPIVRKRRIRKEVPTEPSTVEIIFNDTLKQ